MNAKRKIRPTLKGDSENAGIQSLSIGMVAVVTLIFAGILIDCFCLPMIVFYLILGVTLVLGIGYLIHYMRTV